MENEQASYSDLLYPLIVFPKNCTPFEKELPTKGTILIDLSITSSDGDGKEMNVYSGFCNVKLMDNCDEKIQEVESDPIRSNENISPVIGSEFSQLPSTSYTQSQVWIDPSRSPSVYNDYEAVESQERYSVFNSNARITMQQHFTHITQNVYNYNHETEFSDQFEYREIRKVQTTEVNHIAVDQSYRDDEFGCEIFLSPLSEDTVSDSIIEDNTNGDNINSNNDNGYNVNRDNVDGDNVNRDNVDEDNVNRDNVNGDHVKRDIFNGDKDNSALKQLMSSDIQPLSKQQKTILYMVNDSHTGQTIQKIAINDPCLECDDNISADELVPEKTESNKKKYQCDKCKQIFYQLATFKSHVIGSHKPRIPVREPEAKNMIKATCTDCGKNFKTKERLKVHYRGHGNPELECDKCGKVFASKFTLRTHLKIHKRKYSCVNCPKSFESVEDYEVHMAKIHFIFICKVCDFKSSNKSELTLHSNVHNKVNRNNIDSDSDSSDSRSDSHSLIMDVDSPSSNEKMEEADSVISKVVKNEIFHQPEKKSSRHRIYNKKCEVCQKVFERVSDLKRHLIEHVIRSTLAKTPVNENGTLTIRCEVCQKETFTKIDKYKAHLREHANLTLYKCTFCDKSFSDSSNFSKHRKIHGNTFFKCDLCQRKFHSKKMITLHMEYHKKHSPISCLYCDRKFHFESMLNKHVKYVHNKDISRFRCCYCHEYFKSLKEKWDHEWKIHHVRKVIVDCLICGAKYRKYSELKRHCMNAHNVDIPMAKRIMDNGP